jgi:IS605 OrfB family transposase
MATIYRSYEVLVEETAGNHKTRGTGKTTKEFKPHYENTCRALKVTHELFQDAVCYYIFCLIGLVKNEYDTNGDPFNRMWHYLKDNSLTQTVLDKLASAYPTAPFHKIQNLTEFLSKTYGWKFPDADKPTHAALVTTYKILYAQALKETSENQKTSALEDLKSFAGTWIAILCNEENRPTLPGRGVYDRLHQEISVQIAKLHEAEQLAVCDKELMADNLDAKVKKALQKKKKEAEDNLQNRLKTSAELHQVVRKLVEAEASGRDNDNGGKAGCNNAQKKIYIKAFSSKNTIGEGLKPFADSVLAEISKTSATDPRLRRIQKIGTKDMHSFGYVLYRLLWFISSNASEATVNLACYDALRYAWANSVGDLTADLLPFQKENGPACQPLFPYFTNCLGISRGNRSVWPEFDKSAFKRAAEEVFKYRLRSDERDEQIRKHRTKIAALEGCGEWKDEKSKVKQLGGLEGDEERPRLMRELLDELGGSIGYGMRRATIGGWADLRQEFLRIAKKGEPIDEEELVAAIEKARDASGGGFGSGAFFKALCEEANHPLWLPLKNPKSHHPKNFVRWWVLYSEAKEDLAKVWDDNKNVPNPIAFTWPSTKNRHGEISFRPLDFDIPVTPMPDVDLFDREGDGKTFKLVRANAKPPKQSKSSRMKAVEPKLFTDAKGNALYPLTLSYRRFKRDLIANADGSSVEAEYSPPLVMGKAPAFHEPGNKAPLDSSASLLPANKQGCWHFMFSFKLEREMQKLLVDEAAAIPGEKNGSIRKVKKSGRLVGLNLRWPIDLKTESPKKKDETEVISSDGDEIKEADAKFSVKKIWCSTEFKPFDILSVDLGVRYAGAWCRGHVKIGRDNSRPTERVISPAEHGQEIVYDAYDFGTFRLQGEDAKIWRKDTYKGFANELELEKCGSRGRIASEIERTEFAELAERVFPATKRFPIPTDPSELKFFPDLADHLTYRLRRRLGRIRFLFKLRWQISGKKKKIGHDYKDLAGYELKVFRGDQRVKVIAGLAFIPKESEPDETEDDFMRNLRLKLAPDEQWSKLVYKYDGRMWPLFAKVKGGHRKDNKEESKQKKAAQKAARAKLEIELQSDTSNKWNWVALNKAVKTELDNSMHAFAGKQSLIAEVARFVWPLQDKTWKWTNCEAKKDGIQSALERDENSNEPKRFIHGMRGLSMKRIRLMQDFRQCCQSLAKLERRYYVDADNGLEPSPVQLGDRVYEPAPAFRDKINELREQRVNQTAHMILAEALGLELMNPDKVEIDGKSKCQLKSERDLHGRYKQKKQRVAAIVLEDLSRYRTSQDRSRYENSQLMEWSHRAVIAKLQDMAQVFGLPIITVDARFSSRFCSRTGVPGIRCAQVAKGFESEYPWKKWAEGKDERAKLIQAAAELLKKCDDPKFTLVLPMDGGPAFLPVIPHAPGKEGVEANADINAAVNIGLRAVSHPDRLDVFPVLRTEAKAEGKLEIKNRRGSLSEAVTVEADKRTVTPVIQPNNSPAEKEDTIANEDAIGDDELETGKFPYLFAAVRVGNNLSLLIDPKVRYQLPVTSDGHTVASNNPVSVSAAKGGEFWPRVKQTCWRRIKFINAKRLQSKAMEPPTDWLN